MSEIINRIKYSCSIYQIYKKEKDNLSQSYANIYQIAGLAEGSHKYVNILYQVFWMRERCV